jgi:hypothetical protein
MRLLLFFGDQHDNPPEILPRLASNLHLNKSARRVGGLAFCSLFHFKQFCFNELSFRAKREICFAVHCHQCISVVRFCLSDDVRCRGCPAHPIPFPSSSPFSPEERHLIAHKVFLT